MNVSKYLAKHVDKDIDFSSAEWENSILDRMVALKAEPDLGINPTAKEKTDDDLKTELAQNVKNLSLELRKELEGRIAYMERKAALRKEREPFAECALKDGHEYLDRVFTVTKETEKAVYVEHEAHKAWVPKSVCDIKDGSMYGMAPWFAQKEGFFTI